MDVLFIFFLYCFRMDNKIHYFFLKIPLSSLLLVDTLIAKCEILDKLFQSLYFKSLGPSRS